MVTILYGFPSVRMLIIVLQKGQYRQKLGAMSKDQPPESENSPLHIGTRKLD